METGITQIDASVVLDYMKSRVADLTLELAMATAQLQQAQAEAARLRAENERGPDLEIVPDQ